MSNDYHASEEARAALLEKLVQVEKRLEDLSEEAAQLRKLATSVENEAGDLALVAHGLRVLADGVNKALKVPDHRKWIHLGNGVETLCGAPPSLGRTSLLLASSNCPNCAALYEKVDVATSRIKRKIWACTARFRFPPGSRVKDVGPLDCGKGSVQGYNLGAPGETPGVVVIWDEVVGGRDMALFELERLL